MLLRILFYVGLVMFCVTGALAWDLNVQTAKNPEANLDLPGYIQNVQKRFDDFVGGDKPKRSMPQIGG